MLTEIKPISLSLPYRMGSVNCYLVKTGSGYFLIDTGTPNQRQELEKELESQGCKPGNLQLIVITHGDFDHIGNAAYLREKFNARIAMHADDSGMAEYGDMFWNRQQGNRLIKLVSPVLMRFSKADRFKPDLIIQDGDSFIEFGLDAKAVSIPGHSRGSLGILTASGDLFCGDLLENMDQPSLGSIMDDPQTAKTSVEALKRFEIKFIYPGHGKPFPAEQFFNSFP